MTWLYFIFRNKLNIKQAIDYVAQSWFEVTPITVQNCWQKTDICCNTQESEIQELEMPITTEILGELPANAQTLVQNFEDYVIAVDELIATEDVLWQMQKLKLG